MSNTNVCGMNVDPKTLEQLAKDSPESLLFEPREHFDAAYLGSIDSGEAEDRWPRTAGHEIAVYDEDLCIEAIMAWLDCGEEDALEWFGFNTSGAYIGPHTPTFSRADEL